MINEENIKELITANKRRLQELKMKEAVMGINTPAEILIEIKDIEAELEELERSLDTIDAIPPKPPVTPSPLPGTKPQPVKIITPDRRLVKGYFLHKLRDPVWQFVGVVFTIITLVWSVYVFYSDGNSVVQSNTPPTLPTTSTAPKIFTPIYTVSPDSTSTLTPSPSPFLVLTNTPTNTSTPTHTPTVPSQGEFYVDADDSTGFRFEAPETGTYTFLVSDDNKWQIDPEFEPSTADGIRGEKTGNARLPNAQYGELIMRRNGDYERVGRERSIELARGERIHFLANDGSDAYGDNTGIIKVRWVRS